MKAEQFVYLEVIKISKDTHRMANSLDAFATGIKLFQEAVDAVRACIAESNSLVNSTPPINNERREYLLERIKGILAKYECAKTYRLAKTAFLDSAEAVGFPCRSLKRLFPRGEMSISDIGNDSAAMCAFSTRLLAALNRNNRSKSMAIKALHSLMPEPQAEFAKLLEVQPASITKAADVRLVDYIDLDQCAALVNRSKRTLERQKHKMPKPKIKGHGGKKSEWLWSEMRPWLEENFAKKLPDRPPHVAR